MKQELRAGEVG